MTLSAYDLLIGPFGGFSFMRVALIACLALALSGGPLGVMLLLRRMALDGNVLSHAVMPGAALGFAWSIHFVQVGAVAGLASLIPPATAVGLGGLAERCTGCRPDRVAWPQPRGAAGRRSRGLLPGRAGIGGDAGGILWQQCRHRAGAFRHRAGDRCSGPAADRNGQQPDDAAAGGVLPADDGGRLLARLPAIGWRIWHARPVRAARAVESVVSFQAFGTLLAIGPMLLPAAAARCWTNRPGAMMALASALGMLSSYTRPAAVVSSEPAVGPAIVMIAGALSDYRCSR